MIEAKVQKAGGSKAQKEGKASFFLSINNQMPQAGIFSQNIDEEMSALSEKFKA